MDILIIIVLYCLAINILGLFIFSQLRTWYVEYKTKKQVEMVGRMADLFSGTNIKKRVENVKKITKTKGRINLSLNNVVVEFGRTQMYLEFSKNGTIQRELKFKDNDKVLITLEKL